MTDNRFIPPSDLNDAKSAEDVLNRAPDILYELEEMLSEIQTHHDNRVATITIEEGETKQALLKAIIQLDPERQEQAKKLSKVKAMLERWNNALASAKYFYRKFNP